MGCILQLMVLQTVTWGRILKCSLPCVIADDSTVSQFLCILCTANQLTTSSFHEPIHSINFLPFLEHVPLFHWPPYYKSLPCFCFALLWGLHRFVVAAARYISSYFRLYTKKSGRKRSLLKETATPRVIVSPYFSVPCTR